VASGNRRKPVPEIYLHDTTTNVTSLISRGSKGQNPNGPSSWPAVSGDGRYVAFVSEATNLVRDDLNGRADIFLHDTSVGTTELVSRRPDGKAGNEQLAGNLLGRTDSSLPVVCIGSDLYQGLLA
jgi:Tol biopolymer transport system component